jgi:hypothetical protein
MASLWVFQSINQGSVVAGYGARVSDGQQQAMPSLETAHKVNATQTAAQHPQQLIIRRASENAPEPITWHAPRRGWPRKVRAAEGVTP